MNKTLFPLIMALGFNSIAATPIFKVAELISGQTQLATGQQGTYVYQITNNTSYVLSNIGINNLPAGLSVTGNAGYQYCTFPLNLKSQQNCLLKINIPAYAVY